MRTVAHPHVPHPRHLLDMTTAHRFNVWATRVLTSTLGSMVCFWLCFLIPLLTIPAPDNVKLVVAIIFSSWFQAWALPVLQRSQMAADVKRDAMADANHQALTHIAVTGDGNSRALAAVNGRLARIERALDIGPAADTGP